MREKVVQKLYQNGCTNIISLSKIHTINMSKQHFKNKRIFIFHAIFEIHFTKTMKKV